MYIKSITVAVIALSVSACSVSMQEANSVDFGAKPQDGEKTIIKMIKRDLKDPKSLQVMSITNPARGYSKYGYGTVEYGWYTKIKYNAKNSYGGYTSPDTYTFVYLNGQYKPASPMANGERKFLDEITYLCEDDCPSE